MKLLHHKEGKMIKQNALFILTSIKSDKVEDLRKLLNRIGSDVIKIDIIPFKKLQTVHYMRWLILDKKNTEIGSYSNQLVLSTNYDGDRKNHLIELVTVAEKGFDLIYQYCDGYPDVVNATKESRIDYLKKNYIHSTTFYRGTIGRSVKQIQNENILRIKIGNFLDTNNQSENKAEVIFENIKDFVKGDEELKWAGKPEPTGFKWSIPHILELIWFVVRILSPLILIAAILSVVSFLLHFKQFIEHAIDMSHRLANMINVLAIILLTLVIGFILVKRLLAVLRHYEKTEKSESKTVSMELEQILKAREDILIQNQLSHLVEIKPTRFRNRIIRIVLFAVHNLALFYWNKGKLGSIPTIHFARWVIINNGKRLLFLSNFDNSWESYLGDFVNKAAVGLTGVWSNTVDFPPTKNLIFAGATNEEVFKKWSRYNQIPTQVWYTAYPNISVRNIINNTKIRSGLYKNLKGEKLKEWLRRF